MLVPGGLQFLIISTCFAWCPPVTSISKSHVLTARARMIAILMHDFLFVNKRLLISCDTGIYAIIKINLFTEQETQDNDFAKHDRFTPLRKSASRDFRRKSLICDVAIMCDLAYNVPLRILSEFGRVYASLQCPRDPAPAAGFLL